MKNQNGLTLTEILIAVGVIILIGLAGFFFLSSNSETAGLADDTPDTAPITNEVPAPGQGGVDEMIVNDIMEREDEAMEGDEEVMEKNGDVMKNDGDVMENEGEAMMQDDSNDVVKTISIVAKQWEFIPSTIEVSKGDTVKLVIESVDVSHGISLPQFGVSAFLSPGNVTEVEFIADKAGTFAFFCNVQCGRGHGGMRGTLIVN